MSIIIVCPRNRNHRIEWDGGILFDSDMFPCEQCGPDEFIRISMSMETHTEWRNSRGEDEGDDLR